MEMQKLLVDHILRVENINLRNIWLWGKALNDNCMNATGYFIRKVVENGWKAELP